MGMSTLNSSAGEFHGEHDDPWEVDTDAEDGEELKDDENLTLLVRKSYLTHLEKCLRKNYEESLANTDSCFTSDSKVEELVAFLAKHLEKKALRSSMRASVYQQCMVRQIEAIKKATKGNFCHPIFSEREMPVKKELCENGTQTEESEKDAERINVQNMFSEAFGLSPTFQEDHEGIDSYEQLLNILTASPVLEENHTPNRNKESPLKAAETVDTRIISTTETPRMNLDERLKQLGLLTYDDEQCNNQNKENSSILNDPGSPQVNSTVEEPPNKLKRCHVPSSWTKEAAIQTELVESILKRKSPFKRAIIEQRFKDLFGSEVSCPDFFIAPEELLEARRHTAGHVVKALTPFFLRGKIGSRQVFKTLAKRITDRILSRTDKPDSSHAKREVKICFAIKPEMLRLEDVEEIFSTLA